MQAVIRSFHSPDADMGYFLPEDPENVGILVQMMVGPSDGPGEESFDVVVCTTRWLDRQLREEGVIWGRGTT